MKKTIALLTAVLLCTILASAAPSLEHPESSGEMFAAPVASLFEERTVTPGINVLTGTKAAWDCTTLPSGTTFNGLTKLVNDDIYGTAIKSTTGSGSWTGTDMLRFASPLPAGTYEISFKAARISDTAVSTGWAPLYVLFNGDSAGVLHVEYECFNDFYTTESGEWRTFRVVLTTSSAINSFALHGTWNESAGEYALFDDLFIAPYSGVLNYITDTEATLGFEDGVLPSYVKYGTTAPSVVSNPIAKADNLYALSSATKSGENYPNFTITPTRALTPGSYIVSFDEYKTSTGEVEDSPNSWILYGSTNTYVSGFVTAGAWIHKDVVLHLTDTVTLLRFQWETKMSNETVEAAYFDNFRVDRAVTVTYGDTGRVEYEKMGLPFTPSVTKDDANKLIVGWAVSSNVKEDELPDTITPTGNITLYPVYCQDVAPRILSQSSVRLDAHKGLRLAATAACAVRDSSLVEEYGFLITRKTLLEELELKENALVFSSTGIAESEYIDHKTAFGDTPDGVPIVTGRNYSKTYGIDVVYDIDGSLLNDERILSGEAVGVSIVLTGIPATHYDDTFVIRSYVKVGSTFYYGPCVQRSYYQAVKALYESEVYSTLTQEQKEEITNILDSMQSETTEKTV